MDAARASLGAKRLRNAIGMKLAAEVFGRLAQFGTLALAARALTLAEFGQYGLALVLGFLVAQLADFGLHLLVTRRLSQEGEGRRNEERGTRNEERGGNRSREEGFAERALGTKLGLLVVLGGLSGVGVIFGGGSLALLGLVLSSLVYSLAEFGFAVMRARAQLHYEARLVVLHRFSLLGGAGVVFLGGAGLNGLAITHLLASGVVAAAALKLSQVKFVTKFDLSLLKAAAPVGLAIFLSLLAFKIDVPLLQLLGQPGEEVGLYNAAYRLFEPVLLFPAAIMAGFFPMLVRTSPGTQAGGQTARLIVGLGSAGIAAGGGLVLTARWIMPLLFGPQYEAAGPTLMLLGVAVPFLFINSGLTHLLLAQHRERYNLAFFGVALIINIGANLLLIPAWGRNGAAVATVLTELGLSIMCGVACLLLLRNDPLKNGGANRSLEAATLSQTGTGRISSGAKINTIQISQPHLWERASARDYFPGTNNREQKLAPTEVYLNGIQAKTDEQPLQLDNSNKTEISSRAKRWQKFGFWAVLVLVISLPFEVTQYPLLSLGSFLTLSNLEIIYYVNLILALLTLWERRGEVQRQLRWNSPLPWLGLLVLVCIISSGLGVVPKASFKFTLNLVFGGILWLALPFWLEEGQERKLRWLRAGLVGGAALSAGLGLLEFIPELDMNNWLLWPFKAGATVAGPFLRLSGTFEYANIAAIYYELVLPFALVGLAGAIEKANFRKPELRRLWPVGLWAIGSGLLWEALLLSFSRSALPGMLVAAPLIWWVTRKTTRNRSWGIGIGLGLGVILIGATIILSPVMILRFRTQSDIGWFKAGYSAPGLTSLIICQQLRVPLTVHNQTPLDWRGGPDGAYKLSYHWLDQSDHILVFEGLRTELPMLLKAGEKATVQARLRAPNKAGQYWLVWDVVQEEISWFSLKSAVYDRQVVEVLPDDGTGCAAPPISTRNPPSVLPTTPPNPERGQLWKVAGQMIVARPILGVGPDGYRFAYGAYAGLKSWDERIFANSTPLELAADLGLPGVLLALIFVGLTIWPIVVKGWRGQLTLFDGAVLAALTAFGLHGLLDYFLGFHPIFILFWLLLAIAMSVRNFEF